MVINRQYYKQDVPVLINSAEEGFTFSNEVLQNTIRRIYAKEFDTATDIDLNTWGEFWKVFNQATDEGFGVRGYNDRDYDFYKELRYNNGVFAAFRTHRFQNDIARQLLDENGELKPYERFVQDVNTLVAPAHLQSWLQTEYSTAVIRARQAAAWKRFEANKNELPNLKWIESSSLHPGEDHMIFWNTIRPLDDVFWEKHRPGDRWNCKCDLEATDEPVTEKSDIPAEAPLDRPSPGLDNNPGKDGRIFSDTHPYVKNAYKGAKEAVQKFIEENLPEPEQYKEKRFKSGGIVQTPVTHKQNSVEEKKNLKAYTELAKYYGSQYKLLGVINEQGRKNPDALNLNTGYFSDAKIPVTDKGKNAIQASIKAAGEQNVQEVYIYLEKEYSMIDIRSGLKAALQPGRSKSLKTIIIRFGSGEVRTYNVAELRTMFHKIHRRKP